MMKLLKLSVLTFILLLGACTNEEGNKNLEGDLDTILESIYENADYDNSNLAVTEVKEERLNYYFGEADVDYTEAIASEPAIGWGHSIVLLRATEGSDISAMKQSLLDNVDKCKWVCVCADEVVVENVGDCIVIIIDNNAEPLKEAFLSLAEEV